MLKRFIPLVGIATALAATTFAPALTVVIDMKSAAQPTTVDENGYSVSSFNYSGFGFTTAAQQNALDASILQNIKDDYLAIPTTATLATSPIPAGFQLNIDFVLGDIGTAPSNGDTEYYYAQVGTGVVGAGAGVLGIAGLNTVRSATGGNRANDNGAVVCSIFSQNINSLTGLTPSNALTSGNLLATTYGVGGTLAHEIGHNLSLSHINKAGSVQPSGPAGAGGLSPLMGTGAIDLPNNDRIQPREFSLSGFDAQNGNVARAHIAQLVSAIGLRAVPEPTAMAALALLGIGLVRRTRRADAN